MIGNSMALEAMASPDEFRGGPVHQPASFAQIPRRPQSFGRSALNCYAG